MREDWGSLDDSDEKIYDDSDESSEEFVEVVPKKTNEKVKFQNNKSIVTNNHTKNSNKSDMVVVDILKTNNMSKYEPKNYEKDEMVEIQFQKLDSMDEQIIAYNQHKIDMPNSDLILKNGYSASKIKINDLYQSCDQKIIYENEAEYSIEPKKKNNRSRFLRCDIDQQPYTPSGKIHNSFFNLLDSAFLDLSAQNQNYEASKQQQYNNNQNYQTSKKQQYNNNNKQNYQRSKQQQYNNNQNYEYPKQQQYVYNQNYETSKQEQQYNNNNSKHNKKNPKSKYQKYSNQQQKQKEYQLKPHPQKQNQPQHQNEKKKRNSNPKLQKQSSNEPIEENTKLTSTEIDLAISKWQEQSGSRYLQKLLVSSEQSTKHELIDK